MLQLVELEGRHPLILQEVIERQGQLIQLEGEWNILLKQLDIVVVGKVVCQLIQLLGWRDQLLQLFLVLLCELLHDHDLFGDGQDLSVFFAEVDEGQDDLHWEDGGQSVEKLGNPA